MKSRLAAYAIAVCTAAGVVLTGGGAAQAAVDVNFSYVRLDDEWIIGMEKASNRDYMGQAEWFRDPSGSIPGDTLYAADVLADGYGIEAHVTTSPERIATTRGHAAFYKDRASGDLPEDTKYYMYACVVKGSYSNCSNSIAVYS